MTKAEKILDYVHKTAERKGISYEEAEQLEITREYIRTIEGDCETIRR